jgi:hypothetical protein
MTLRDSLVFRLTVAGCLLLSANCLKAHVLSGIESKWSDSYVEWDLYTLVPQDTTRAGTKQHDPEAEPEEVRNGELKLRWLTLKEDWTDWEYQVGEERGNIKSKWKDDPSQWELRAFTGNIVTMRTAWSKDLTEWRVTDNSITLVLKTRYTNQLDDWSLRDSAHGTFRIYTQYRQDPRDWIIDDQLDASITPSMKMALVFLAVYHGSPKM